MPPKLFDGFRDSAAADSPAWLKGFLDNFYNIDQFRGNRVSDEAYNASFNVAVTMSAIADANLVVVEGGPHAIPWTHTDQVNKALLGFLGH